MSKIIKDIPSEVLIPLIEEAMKSTCKRSKCGSVIADANFNIIGAGYNSMPCNDIGECFKDSLPSNFKSDKTCCVHAEQRAIMNVLKSGASIENSVLYFIRLDLDNKPMYAGKPYCSICSKMALDAGIKQFMLWHEEGWTSYDTKEYNELTFKYGNS